MTEAEIRAIVREEIASLAGLAMRRLQDESLSRMPQRNMAVRAAKDVMGHFWAEVLAEYGSDEETKAWPVPKASAETSGIAADYAESAE